MLSFLNRSTEKSDISFARMFSKTPPLPEASTTETVRSHEIVFVKSEEQVVSDFKADLDAALKDVEIAFAQSKKSKQEIEQLRASLQDRGFWGTLKGTFDASTDKELAKQIFALGSSLELTQKVVRVILRVQTQKNRLLQEFNRTLVNKITNIQGDTRTLDENQRTAALEFLGELRQQIEEQILQQELVASHERQLLDHKQWIFEVGNENLALEKNLGELSTQAEDFQQKFSELAKWKIEVEHRDAATHQYLVQITQSIASIKKTTSKLEAKVAVLEDFNRAQRSLKALFIRQLLPLAAIAVATISLFSGRMMT